MVRQAHRAAVNDRGNLARTGDALASEHDPAGREPESAIPPDADAKERPSHSVARWFGMVMTGAVAVSGGGIGCLLFLVILLSPLIIFFAIFGQGLLSIFEG
jgi:hypothetical protein